MKPALFKLPICFSIVLDFASSAVLVAFAFPARAEPVTVVVPNVLASVEGNTNWSGSDLNFVFPNGFRYQAIYPASEFASVPDSHRWIVGIRFRPDVNVTAPRTHSSDMSTRSLSTTSKGPAELSLTFAEYIGTDEVVVQYGPLTVTTDAEGPPGGPHSFDYDVGFQRPFFYDPSEGNLLLNTVSAARTEFWANDFHNDIYGMAAVVNSNSSNSASGGPAAVAVAQFVFVPEADADRDGDVDIDDLNAVRNHFGMSGPDDGSLPGDTVPWDGLVNIDDLNAVRNHFGAGTTNAVPEPGTFAIVTLWFCLLLAVWRRA
jgi:hypothetical protein